MRIKGTAAPAGWIIAAALAFHPAAAQQAPPPMRETVTTAIPGVIEGGLAWELAWSGDETADGMVAGPDGALWFAQEQTSSIIALGADSAASVHMTGTEGAGSLSINTQGQLLAVQRTCTDPGLPDDENCAVPTKVAVLAPEPATLADRFADGRTLGRLNDLTADSRGGAYFTVGGAYYASPEGAVSTVVEGEGVRTNGIVLSPDERTLYVTNGAVVLAFDVAPDGSTSNRRDFARLEEGDGGDGMTVDAEGRLYVTSVAGSWGVYVFDAKGERLGFIPTPRRAVSVAFAGPEKKTLFVSAMGALDPDGSEHVVPEGVRNTAMTVYRTPMLAAGFAGRAK
jgi:gluconolactonase